MSQRVVDEVYLREQLVDPVDVFDIVVIFGFGIARLSRSSRQTIWAVRRARNVNEMEMESKDRSEDIGGVTESSEPVGPTIVREIPPSTGVSYAVAIYPYMAEQEDEFDVVV